MDKPNILVIGGTAREGSNTHNVASHINKRLSERDDMNVSFFDLHNVEMSIKEDATKELPEYKELVLSADGFVIVSPEYNHALPGSLKMVLDLLYKEYKRKAVGYCGVSSGGFGGARVVEALVPITRELGMVPIQGALYASRAGEMFDESGNPKDGKFNERIDKFADELVWMAATLKHGRENIK